MFCMFFQVAPEGLEATEPDVPDADAADLPQEEADTQGEDDTSTVIFGDDVGNIDDLNEEMAEAIDAWLQGY